MWARLASRSRRWIEGTRVFYVIVCVCVFARVRAQPYTRVSAFALTPLPSRSALIPAYVNSRVTFAVISYDVYGNRYTLEGLDFIVIVRKGPYARVWDAVSQCDGRYHVSGDFPFKGQYSIEVTSPSLDVHALGSPFLVRCPLSCCVCCVVLCGLSASAPVPHTPVCCR
jgi:hypothetical protein